MPTASRVHLIFQRFQEQNPVPETELEYTNPYTLLVAVVLSAQATDKSVNLATAELFQHIQTPQDMLKLSLEELEGYVRRLNYFRTKAKNIMALSQQLVDRHDGQVPDTRADLEALPGVGRKTANVVLSVAFHQDTLAVDTHIFRVAQRLELAKGKNPDEIEQQLLRIIPKEYLRHAHHWLILHGRYVCQARKPKCSDCLVRDLCPFPNKN